MKNVWAWLSGKKTTIAGIYWAIVIPALAYVYKGNTPQNIDNAVYIVGLVLTYVGLGHAAIKQIQGGKPDVQK